MTDPILFEMSAQERAKLIAKHLFYVAQAKTRLLGQFYEDDIRAEADSHGERFLAQNQDRYNPEIHDGSEFFSTAGEVRDERYQLLAEMRVNTRLSIIAGFFHIWEKSLREWLSNQVKLYPWRTGERTRSAIWRRNLCQKDGGLFDLLDSFGWSFKSKHYFPELDACRLVVNVYKHGNGDSLDTLAASYPKFLKHPLGEPLEWLGERWSHENLQITDHDLDMFSSSIEAFWRDVPENVLKSHVGNLPRWLKVAIETDHKTKEQQK